MIISLKIMSLGNSTFEINHDLPFDFEMNLFEKDV